MKRFTEIGKFNDFLYLLGNPFMPIYYLNGGELSILIDSGVTFTGLIVANQIKEFGLKIPERVLLTHSHYDHLGGIPALKRRFPEIKVAAHPRVGEILKRENAVKLIVELNEKDEKFFGASQTFDPAEYRFEPFEIDFYLKEGDLISLGTISVKVLETPGHTKDSLSFYVPEIKALFFGEAGGVPDISGRIHPEFTSSYENYLNSLKKMLSLEVEIIGLAHGGIIYGEDARTYIEKSIKATEECKERILQYYRESGSVEKVVERIFNEDYKKGTISQPETPYLINLKSRVRKVLEVFA